MDEPTVGLEPFDQQRFIEFIRERRRGVTVFLASGAVSVTRRLCDRAAVLQNAQLLGTEPVESLNHRGGKVVHNTTTTRRVSEQSVTIPDSKLSPRSGQKN